MEETVETRQLAGWHRIREVTAKRLRLLRDLVPKAVRVAVLLNPANVSAAEATSPFPPSCVASFALAVFVLVLLRRGACGS